MLQGDMSQPSERFNWTQLCIFFSSSVFYAHKERLAVIFHAAVLFIGTEQKMEQAIVLGCKLEYNPKRRRVAKQNRRKF